MCDIINKLKIYVTMIAQNDMRYEITHRHQRTHLTKKKKKSSRDVGLRAVYAHVTHIASLKVRKEQIELVS